MYFLSGPIGIGIDSVANNYNELDKSDGKIFASALSQIIGLLTISAYAFAELAFIYVWVVGLVYLLKEEIIRLYIRFKQKSELGLVDTRI